MGSSNSFSRPCDFHTRPPLNFIIPTCAQNEPFVIDRQRQQREQPHAAVEIAFQFICEWGSHRAFGRVWETSSGTFGFGHLQSTGRSVRDQQNLPQDLPGKAMAFNGFWQQLGAPNMHLALVGSPRMKLNPWLTNRVSPFSGDSDHFWREHPPNHGTGLLILGQH